MGRAFVILVMTACGRIGFDTNDDDGTTQSDGGGQATSAVSCAGSVPSCGPTASSSCCESPLVPGGTFIRSYDGVGYDDTSNTARVGAFRLDRYEVTVGRFRQFVNAGLGTQATAPASGAGARLLNGTLGGGWDPAWNTRLGIDTAALEAALACSAQYETWTPTPAGNESRPINCVDWAVAIAFCIWDGGFLPTEAEWNFAAAGGEEQRAYPWSVPPTSLALDPSHASYALTFDSDCLGDGIPACSREDLIVVGSKPAGNGRWGHADLGGNAYEWTLDWYEDAYQNPCTDCVSMTSAYGMRSYRGGAFRYASSALRNGYRNAWTADDRSGFRCARLP